MNEVNAKILVVDDVAENRDLLVRRLQRLGLQFIDQATNGVEALEALNTKSYDLMLLDIMMPEMDGFEVLDALRLQGRVGEPPIVVISAMNELDAIVRCIERGAEDFLFKPFNPVILRARVMASLEKKALRDKTRDELRRKQAELNEARTLQLALVPPPYHAVHGDWPVAIDVYLEPAKEVGGDLVDHFRIGDNLLVFLVGDVSDKGAGAALMMARTHSMFRTLASRPDAFEIFVEPSNAMTLVNDALATGNASNIFVTMFLGALDLSTMELKYVRAGHVPPFQRLGASGLARLDQLGGPPLGLVEEIRYKQHTASISPNDSLLVLTDGFTEATGPDGQLFGNERVADILLRSDPAAADTLTSLVKAAREFEAGQPQFDDMAAVLLSFRPLPTP